ncbi:MAG: poly(R)-hydroxyalkanoic acid synthase subunit PhaE [Thermochromatium sp.]
MGLAGDSASTVTPWEATMDQWWKVMAPAVPDLARTFMDKLMEQGKHFFCLTDSLAQCAKEGSASSGFEL